MKLVAAAHIWTELRVIGRGSNQQRSKYDWPEQQVQAQPILLPRQLGRNMTELKRSVLEVVSPMEIRYLLQPTFPRRKSRRTATVPWCFGNRTRSMLVFGCSWLWGEWQYNCKVKVCWLDDRPHWICWRPMQHAAPFDATCVVKRRSWNLLKAMQFLQDQQAQGAAGRSTVHSPLVLWWLKS